MKNNYLDRALLFRTHEGGNESAGVFSVFSDSLRRPTVAERTHSNGMGERPSSAPLQSDCGA